MKRLHENFSNKALPVAFTKEQYDRAVERAKQHPDRSTDNQSITRGKGLLTGCLGEIIVEDYLENVKSCDDNLREMKDKFNFDILLKDGTTIEVKSKGHGVSDCPSFYDCSVSAINPRQKADYYVFVRIHGKRLSGTYGFDHSNSNKAWICGMKAKQDMIQPQRLMKRGTVVQNSSNFNYVAKSSCYQIKISELEPLEKDFGAIVNLTESGSLRLVRASMKEFALQKEEDEFFLKPNGQVFWFEGLSSLTVKEKEHFDTRVAFYAEEEDYGEEEIQRFKRQQ